MEKIVDFTFNLGGLMLECTATITKELPDDVTDGYTEIDVFHTAHNGITVHVGGISYDGTSLYQLLEDKAIETFMEN